MEYMVRRKIPFILLLLCMWQGGGILYGQFYNGHQMTFGKNRVQYNDFYWSYYRFERFDTYFTQDGNELALYAESVATPELNRIEGIFDYAIEKRIIFIIYNKLTDFRQGNIGLITGIDEYNTGGVTRIVDNKVFLYFNGDHEAFQQQIRASIAEIVLNEMLYGSALRTNMTRSATINMPEWFHQGLISYISEPWSVEMDDRIKNGLANGTYRKFTRLNGEDAKWAGHSFWRFIEKEYGIAVLSNIVYITRLNKNAKSGFMAVLGDKLKGLSKAWYDYYSELYAKEDGRPHDHSSPIVKKPRKYRVYTEMKISPDGQYLAYVTNDMGKYKIWLHHLETGRKKRIFRREQKLEQIQDYSYPVLAWHPSGHILLFIYEEKGGLKMTFYDTQLKERQTRNLLYFEKVLSADFSPDGGKIVMSAYRFGRSDIFVHTFASSTNEAVTDDLADDFNPKFIRNGTKIIFSSTRTDDSIRYEGAVARKQSPYKNLFVYDYARKDRQLIPLAEEPHANQIKPVETALNRYAFLSDKNGVVNRYSMSFDSVINYIDTAIHYRYSTQSYPISDYSRNILDHDVDAENQKTVSLFRGKNRFNMYSDPLAADMPEALPPTAFRREIERKQRARDSTDYILQNAIPAILLDDGNILTPEGDTIRFDPNKVDIYRYVFEVEKLNFYQNEFELTDFKLLDDSIKLKRNQIRIYEPIFYPNYLVSQVDFSFLETSYQAYTGGAVYYNPGFNMLFKLGTTDLFEDYKIIGGVRFGLDFSSNEYLLSFENLKKRLDKQLIFHRQAYENYAVDESNIYYPLKTHTHELFYSLRYPFTQTSAIKATASFRNDRTVFLADNSNPASLTMPNEHRMWAGLKLELIFDNIRKIGINIPSGLRYKIFGESYWEINNNMSDLYVLGADFRYYQVIHRNLIWATRFAGSSSFGRSRLLYYLGSLDNWINWFGRHPTFDNTVRVDHQENYAYQTLATNMRGFVQNIRNGNNFALINNELRWPFVQYFSKYPLSNFWSSLQLVGFFDMGTAWSGVSPFRKTSAYDYEYVTNNSVTVTIDMGRDPIVYGYGCGLRMQLLGYFMRFDYAWGIENRMVLPGIFYFSMNLDF
jgi:Tol biopolymer transport system component